MKLPDDFVKKIAQALQDEEVDVYVLTLYSFHSADLEYFNAKDRARIKSIFKVLIEDTQHHTELLKLIVELAESK